MLVWTKKIAGPSKSSWAIDFGRFSKMLTFLRAPAKKDRLSTQNVRRHWNQKHCHAALRGKNTGAQFYIYPPKIQCFETEAQFSMGLPLFWDQRTALNGPTSDSMFDIPQFCIPTIQCFFKMIFPEAKVRVKKKVSLTKSLVKNSQKRF